MSKKMCGKCCLWGKRRDHKKCFIVWQDLLESKGVCLQNHSPLLGDVPTPLPERKRGGTMEVWKRKGARASLYSFSIQGAGEEWRKGGGQAEVGAIANMLLEASTSIGVIELIASPGLRALSTEIC